ncbi:polyprenyl synthetase family protein [Streptomyces sp. NPDC015144]|uniref:polyprenyl synthetase family protein n=1 Tax=Streptomyces sp. NPDC015144 TaxID=3364944 RepID=UPI0036F8ED32
MPGSAEWGSPPPVLPDQIAAAARRMLLPHLRDVVGRIPPPLHTPCAYYFGWVDEAGRTVAYRGPSFRVVTLVLLSAGVGGGSWRRARSVAAACALIHGYGLICDDVIDEDAARRGVPTVWKAFGVPTAILAADTLLTMALTELTELTEPSGRTPPVTAEVRRVLLDAMHGAFRAQALEAQYQRRGGASLRQALEVVDGKSSDWVAACCEAGALQGGADPARAELMRSFGWHLGRVMQVRDDLLDVYGEPGTGVPPRRDDLRARKKTSIVCAALESGHPFQDELALYYQRPDGPHDGELGRMADLVERCGGRDWAERAIAHHLRQARSCVCRAVKDRRLAELMCAYADQFTHRSVGDEAIEPAGHPVGPGP